MQPSYKEKFPDFKGHNFIRESYPVDLNVRTFGKRGPRRNKAENVDIKTTREKETNRTSTKRYEQRKMFDLQQDEREIEFFTKLTQNMSNSMKNEPSRPSQSVSTHRQVVRKVRVPECLNVSVVKKALCDGKECLVKFTRLTEEEIKIF